MAPTPELSSFRRSEIAKLTHITNQPLDGRLVPLCPYYDGADWFLWMPYEDTKLIRMQGGEPITGSYFARAAARQDDVEIPIATLSFQHLSFPDVMTECSRFLGDVSRDATVLEKYQLVWTARGNEPRESSLLVESELQFLLLLLRSQYDSLQRLIRTISRRWISLDGSAKRVVNDLPTSFAGVVLAGEKERSASEISGKWGVPPQLASWYAAETEFFQLLKQMRDGLVHRGERLPTIFETEHGFAVSPADEPWDLLPLWTEHPLFDGRLGSLRSIFVSFVQHSVSASSRCGAVLRSCCRLPDAIAGDLSVFLRTPFGVWLRDLEALRKQPWEGFGRGAVDLSPD